MRTIRLAAAIAGAVLALPAAARGDDVLNRGTKLWVNPDSSTRAAARQLHGADRVNAMRLAAIPSATWLTKGTQQQARQEAFTVGLKSNLRGETPVLAAYDIPGRDCSQYSAGGAANTREYKAWINGVAQGLGFFRAAVILEPDGIALPPADCGGTPEQQAARIRQMNFAVDKLQSLPRTAVYIDAGHSAWHAVGTIAARLVANGIDEADGFFLNVSNYRTNADLVRYGTMVSKCISYISDQNGSPNDCANQYWPPADADAWYASPVRPPRGPRPGSREPRPGHRCPAPLRDRHEPQRPGTVDAAREHLQRSAGL